MSQTKLVSIIRPIPAEKNRVYLKWPIRMNPCYKAEFFFNPRIIGPKLKQLLKTYRDIPLCEVVLRHDQRTRVPYLRIDIHWQIHGIKAMTEGVQELKERMARQQKEDGEA